MPGNTHHPHLIVTMVQSVLHLSLSLSQQLHGYLQPTCLRDQSSP